MTATAAPPLTTTGARDDLDAARFIDLVTFRLTGEPVGTPVLFVRDGARVLVRTAHDAGKLKRIAHTPAVELTPSDQKGRHLGATWSGTARILGPDAVPSALARLHAKHRIAGPLFTWMRHRRGQRDVIVEILLDVVP